MRLEWWKQGGSRAGEGSCRALGAAAKALAVPSREMGASGGLGGHMHRPRALSQALTGPPLPTCWKRLLGAQEEAGSSVRRGQRW